MGAIELPLGLHENIPNADYHAATYALSNSMRKVFSIDGPAHLKAMLDGAPEDAPPEEIIRVDTDRVAKSPSKRLYSVLFVLWKQQGEKGTFDNFYVEMIESYIDKVNEQLT